MRYFLDTEFNQDTDPVELISLGIVCEDGREFYSLTENDLCDWRKCGEWLQENVLPSKVLYAPQQVGTPWQPGSTYVAGRRFKEELKSDIEGYLGDDPAPEFWGYYADYDWYLFTRLWGFMDMPKRFPKLCLDLQQYAFHLHVPRARYPEALKPEHNALADARWNKKLFDFLESIAKADW